MNGMTTRELVAKRDPGASVTSRTQAAHPERAREAATSAPQPPDKGTSLWRDAWRRLLRNRMAVASGAVLLIIGLVTVLAPVLPGLADPDLQNLELGATAPSRAHPYGTDLLGRDLLSRVVYGGRVSILVGIVATLVSFVVGVSYGATSG